MTTPDNDDLRERAREQVEHLPAETALGNADPGRRGGRGPEGLRAEHTSHQQ